jgi:hypothetical protein
MAGVSYFKNYQTGGFLDLDDGRTTVGNTVSVCLQNEPAKSTPAFSNDNEKWAIWRN